MHENFGRLCDEVGISLYMKIHVKEVLFWELNDCFNL